MHRDEFALAYCLTWLVVIIMFLFLFAGCERGPIGQSGKQSIVERAPALRVQTLEATSMSDLNYVEFEMAGCEYFYIYNGHGHLMHKPQCKGCKKEK